MKMGLSILLSVFVLCACISQPAAVVATLPASDLQIIPTKTPVPIRSIEVYDEEISERILVDVRSLTPQELRSELSATTTFITIEKQNASGEFDYLGSGGSVERGVYRVTFDYVNYTTDALQGPAGESLGVGQIGVGLRMVASITNSSGRVNLSGLLPLGLAAEAGSISGSLSLRVLGLSNDKLALTVPGSLTLDASGIQKAFESAAAVRVLFVDDDTVITPWLLGVADVTEEQAPAALDAAGEKLAENPTIVLSGDQTAQIY